MKSIDRIPTSKIERASKIVTTGLKVGVNYAKYYGQKIVYDESEAKQQLNSANAEDIYDGLKELKGSALKVAQMLSMEKTYCRAPMSRNFRWPSFRFLRCLRR